jgi:hypothetical protein
VGGKSDQSIFPLLFKRNEGTCYYVKAEKFDADSEKRSNFPWPEKRKRVRKTKEEVKKKMVENQNKNIIGGKEF